MGTTDELTLLQGTLDILVLRTLAFGPQHGYAVAQSIRQRSGDLIAIEDRALYLALHRLEDRGAIISEWGLSDNNRRAKYYELTAEGRRALRTGTGQVERYVAAMLRVLGPAKAPRA